jgi:hypothetical protein
LPPESNAPFASAIHPPPSPSVCCAACALDQRVDFSDDGQHVFVVFGYLAQAEQDVDQLVVDGV